MTYSKAAIDRMFDLGFARCYPNKLQRMNKIRDAKEALRTQLAQDIVKLFK